MFYLLLPSFVYHCLISTHNTARIVHIYDRQPRRWFRKNDEPPHAPPPIISLPSHATRLPIARCSLFVGDQSHNHCRAPPSLNISAPTVSSGTQKEGWKVSPQVRSGQEGRNIVWALIYRVPLSLDLPHAPGAVQENPSAFSLGDSGLCRPLPLSLYLYLYMLIGSRRKEITLL